MEWLDCALETERSKLEERGVAKCSDCCAVAISEVASELRLAASVAVIAASDKRSGGLVDAGTRVVGGLVTSYLHTGH